MTLCISITCRYAECRDARWEGLSRRGEPEGRDDWEEEHWQTERLTSSSWRRRARRTGTGRGRPGLGQSKADWRKEALEAEQLRRKGCSGRGSFEAAGKLRRQLSSQSRPGSWQLRRPGRAERTGLCWGMERGRRSGWSEGSGFSGGIDGPRQLERGGLGKKYCATIYSCHFHPCLNIYEQGYPHPSPRVDADKVSSWASLLENIRLGRKWQAKYYTGVIIVWWVYWSPGYNFSLAYFVVLLK